MHYLLRQSLPRQRATEQANRALSDPAKHSHSFSATCVIQQAATQLERDCCQTTRSTNHCRYLLNLSLLCCSHIFEFHPFLSSSQRFHVLIIAVSQFTNQINMKAFSTVSARSGVREAASRAPIRRIQGSSKSQPETPVPICRTHGPWLRKQFFVQKAIRMVTSNSTARTFTSYRPLHKGLSPDSSDPQPPEREAHNVSKLEAADLADAEYHEIADQYMNTLQLTLDEVAEQDAQKGLEVEFSVCSSVLLLLLLLLFNGETTMC